MKWPLPAASNVPFGAALSFVLTTLLLTALGSSLLQRRYRGA